jgi:transaldolase
MWKPKHVKLFSDGADRASMLEMAAQPWVSGLTTNPTLMAKAGIRDYKAFCKDILAEIREKPISFEVFSDEFTEMRRQAEEIASWGKNIYVKIPVTNSLGQPSTDLIAYLTQKNIKLNVTAVFSTKQTLDCARALSGGAPSIVSIFAGRIADSGRDPVPLMRTAIDICRAVESKIEVLWASPRELLNIIQADEIGCDIITVTPDLLKKTNLFGKTLEEFSLDTVKMFKGDAEKAGYQL